METIFHKLHIDSVSFKRTDAPGFKKDSSVGLFTGKKSFGNLGELETSILEALDIQERVFGFEIDIHEMMRCLPKNTKYHPIPKFPPVKRDLAFIIDADIPAEHIESQIIQSGGKELISAEIFDLYQGKQIPSGKKSIAFSLTFLSHKKTLKEDEVDPAVSAIIQSLQAKFNAELRS